MKPFGDHWKPTILENPTFTCRNCGENDIWYYLDESSDGAYEDYCYHCAGCDHTWWVESSDY